MTVLSWLVALVVTFPLLGYFLAYFVAKKIRGDKKRALLISFDIGAFFLLLSIHFSSKVVFGESMLGYVLLLSAFILVFITIMQRGIERLRFVRSLRRSWRVNGLIYMIVYISILNYEVFGNMM
ncbi:DUF3397 domain-containing protein (plasmid) [Rossellomorea sp. AcN35-11]|nr:DUF3397 domain-containing protein [Rossellomorea aquimaris]WJV32204.1 DUF3397 domain-containing protein [Rossellomorea sp. AcN35-11]